MASRVICFLSLNLLLLGELMILVEGGWSTSRVRDA